MRNPNGSRHYTHSKLLQALEECMNAQSSLKTAATALEVCINMVLRAEKDKRPRISEVA